MALRRNTGALSAGRSNDLQRIRRDCRSSLRHVRTSSCCASRRGWYWNRRHVRADARRLPPSARARGCLHRSLRRAAHARRHIFPRQVARYASLDQIRPGGNPAIGTRETRSHSLSRVVSRHETPRRSRNGIQQGGFSPEYSSRRRADPDLRDADRRATRPRHLRGHRSHRHRHSFCRRPLVEVAAGRRRRRFARTLPADLPRFVSTGALDGVSQSRLRSARRRISIAAIAHRRGLGRLHRRRLDGEQAETFLSPRSAHRLHLRGDLRRTRLHRRHLL